MVKILSILVAFLENMNFTKKACLTHTKILNSIYPQACLNPDCQEDNTHETENCPWIKCKHCKKFGHSKPDCPDYKCSICFKKGHLEGQHHLYCAVCDEDYKHDTEDCPRVITLQETYLSKVHIF